ncbi:MAG TPA: Na(+)/H(+) antiporter subunit D [Natrialbaceae archaeon]|nr:Na(+)/H(+) antiporter subunit D [Natrialbaceae archaeon]
MADLLTVLPPGVLLVIAAVLVPALPRRWGPVVGVGVPVLVVAWLAVVPAGAHLPARLFGFDVLLFRVDPLSRTVGLIQAFVAAAAAAYGFGTGASRRGIGLSLAYLAAGLGAVFAGDWLTLLLWWEGLAIAATALVWVTGDEAAARAGLRYAVYHELGGIALVAAVLLHFVETGTFLFGGASVTGATGAAAGLAAGLPAFLGAVGIGLNVGFIGFHPWLVDTYPRPHVATSVVLAAVTTKVGVYALARAFPAGSVPLAYVGGAMLLVGVTYAILQTDVRRLLTYHIVSQVGIMVAGIGIGSSLGLAGAFAHLVNNVLYKSLLFMIGGLLILRVGRSNLKQLGGLARPMPVAFGAYLVAAMAIAGVPGFNGFVSKSMVFDAAENAGFDLLWWVLIVGSVGTVISFVKFGYYAFFHGEHDGGEEEAGDAEHPIEDANRLETLALVAIAVPCVLFGLVPALQFAVLPGATDAAKPFAASQFVKAGGVLGAGAVAFVVLKKPLGRIGGVPDLDSVYHPVGARAMRIVAHVVGESGASIDASVKRTTTAAIRAVENPTSFVPDSLDDRLGFVDSHREDAIGASVLLLVLAVALFLFVSYV